MDGRHAMDGAAGLSWMPLAEAWPWRVICLGRLRRLDGARHMSRACHNGLVMHALLTRSRTRAHIQTRTPQTHVCTHALMYTCRPQHKPERA